MSGVEDFLNQQVQQQQAEIHALKNLIKAKDNTTDSLCKVIEILGKNSAVDFERERREVWTRVFVGVAASWNCKEKDVPASWADAALKAFDARFA